MVYASNHRSHTDYLVEPLVLDDAGIRPPIIAAGINLFGGPLGLIHKHVTGALPIRRNTKDPAYLITLKAYVAELLHNHDLFFYPEGGRSYSGELKPRRPGCSARASSANLPGLVIVPVAVVLRPGARGSRAGAAERQTPAARVQPRAGRDGPLRGRLSQPRVRHVRQADRRSTASTANRGRAVLDLAHLVRREIGRLYKVLPTAVLAAAMRPSITRRRSHAIASTALLDTLRRVGANLGVTAPTR